MLVSFSHPSSGRWKSSLGSVTVSTSHHRMLVAQKFNLLCKRNPFPGPKKKWGPGLRFHKFHLIEKSQVFVQWIILVLVKGGRDYITPPRRQYIYIYLIYKWTRKKSIDSLDEGCITAWPPHTIPQTTSREADRGHLSRRWWAVPRHACGNFSMVEIVGMDGSVSQTICI